MKLPKKWEAIAEDLQNEKITAWAAIRKCYALHNKPPRLLTDRELADAYDAGLGPQGELCSHLDCLRSVEAAAHKKQRAPERVKFRAARNKITGKVLMFGIDDGIVSELGTDWEWLDFDGKPQEFEVTLP